MTDSTDRDPGPAHPARLLAGALNNLPLGLIVFDARREVVFCNARYMEIYGLSPQQVKPGTPIGELIRHRLSLGLKIVATPEEYVRERVASAVVPGTTVSIRPMRFSRACSWS